MSYVIKESELERVLPKKTTSLCPECKKTVTADIYEEDGKVMISKTCGEHGFFKDVYWSDVGLYKKAESWAFDGVGVDNPLTKVEKGCPWDCGLCDIHMSHTSLANLDLTNRCNLRCPICFANANDAGYVYEPTFEQVAFMLETLRAERPVHCKAVQFSGGEPTIYPQFIEVIAKAKELDFAQIQIATNGIRMATEPGFTQKMVDAGLHTVYLQFDGLKEENYIGARGRPLLEIKKKALQSIRDVKGGKLSVVLVPTIMNGLNDDQLGDILKFAIENKDVVRSVNYQPVSFTGRIDQEERERGRFTLPDMVDRLVKQTDFIKKEDFFPVPVVTPISEFLSVMKNEPQLAFTPHPHCGLATYLYVDKDGNATPITQFVDVEGLFREILELAKKSEGKRIKAPMKIKAFNLIRKHFKKDKAPEGMGVTKFLRQLEGLFSSTEKEATAEISWGLIMVGGMHFQDLYNYDIERVKRCVIHYVVPDGRIIPFCAFNTGPEFREEVEKKFSITFEEYRERHGKDAVPEGEVCE
jgi:uncharacterized radical SAM superfamily Fe-S cluster-containing enzyme